MYIHSITMYILYIYKTNIYWIKGAPFCLVGGPDCSNGLLFEFIIARLPTVCNQPLEFYKGLLCL